MAAASASSLETVDDGKSFDDMDLKDDLLRGIYAFGFEKPSVIQDKAIVSVAKGEDIIAQAQSGTGKTGAFTIGLLQRVDISKSHIQALVLLPTRELAQQVYHVTTSIGKHMDIKTVLSIGGVMGSEQVREINEGAHIMIGTPGRVYDLIANRIGASCVSNLQMVVLDEADEMLSVGFKDQVREILMLIPQTSQVCLFSATLNPDVMSLTKKFMRDPTEILVNTEELTLDGITQFYVQLREQDKFGALMDLYQSMCVAQSIIYCNSRGRVEEVSTALEKNNFVIGAIHGQMTWDERKKVMDAFRAGTIRVLVGTDLIARGIDVQQVSIVINYDIPRDMANYLHRIGRSGRYGRKGVGINFVTEAAWENLEAIKSHYSTEIVPLPMDFEKFL